MAAQLTRADLANGRGDSDHSGLITVPEDVAAIQCGIGGVSGPWALAAAAPTGDHVS